MALGAGRSALIATFTADGISMKAYLVTTGTLFALLTAAHAWRVVAERHLATDPWYLLITLVSAALAVWAWRLLRLSRSA